MIAQHRSALWKRRTQLRPIRCLRSSSQSQSSLLRLCSPLLSPPDINAFKISVKRLLAIFLPPPLLATHVQLHPDVDLLVLQLRQDARHSPAARSRCSCNPLPASLESELPICATPTPVSLASWPVLRSWQTSSQNAPRRRPGIRSDD